MSAANFSLHALPTVPMENLIEVRCSVRPQVGDMGLSSVVANHMQTLRILEASRRTQACQATPAKSMALRPA